MTTGADLDAVRKSLEHSASNYHDQIVQGWERLYRLKRERLHLAFTEHYVGSRALELGCADGQITQYLAQHFQRVVVVDGVQKFLDETAAKLDHRPHIAFECSLFEAYTPEEKFGSIVIAHVLEHLDDPVGLLERAKEWLEPGGRIFIAVPNALSIHRQVGVKMGMLPSIDALNEQDVKLGHRRVYTPQRLHAEIEQAGYRIIRSGGLMLKPLANRDIEKHWSQELIDAFFAVGEDYPELCSEIYVVAER